MDGPSAWTPAELEQLRDLVMQCWDPIGVHRPGLDDSDRLAYWDEYDDYFPAIIRHLERGDATRALQVELAYFRTKQMGLSARPDLDAVAAETICDWYRNGRPPSAMEMGRSKTDPFQFFADRGFQLDFVEQRTVLRDRTYRYIWAQLTAKADPQTILLRYAGGGNEESASTKAVTRWRVEQGASEAKGSDAAS